MAADPTLSLQKAIYEKLLATPAVVALVGQRIFDRVEAGTQLPYISFGPSQSIPDDADCITAYEIFFQLDAWSEGAGYVQVKRIAGEVKEAIHEADLTLDDYILNEIRSEPSRFFRDGDGITSHAVIEFRALVEPSE